MTQIAIPDELAHQVNAEAAHRGCSTDDLVRLFVLEGLEEPEIELTSELEARLHESVAQIRSGNVVDGDMVMSRFNRVLREIEGQ